MIGFNTVETIASSIENRFRVIRYGLVGGGVKWQKVSAFEGEVIGLQFGHKEEEVLVVARDTSMQVIVSLMDVDDGDVEWTYKLDFKYDKAPMLIDYKEGISQRHHSLATKASDGGFNIARLKINTDNDKLQDIK